MKVKILKLRAEGKTYPEIKNILGCSTGTIAYHCGKGQKEKTKERHNKHKKTINGILKRKKDNFSFIHGRNTRTNKGKRGILDFTAKEFKDKLENNQKCYLTGRSIDILKPKTYHCDHIIPISKGGTCLFDNLGFACKDANMAKNNLSIDEFLNLCKEVLIHHKYKVEKII